MVKLKCESDVDWREMTQAIPQEYLSGLPMYRVKHYLLSMKNGIFMTSLRKATEMHWIYDKENRGIAD